MKNYTKKEIIEIAKKEEVKYIKLQFTDMLGTIKSVEIPASRLEDAMDGKVMFDGSSIEGFVRIKEADMYLHPDLSTFLILPLESNNYGKVARFFCDVYQPNGEVFPGDPRANLKRILKKMEAMGFKNFNVGVEPEFYLFKLDEKGHPILEFNDQGSYFDLAPLDGGENCRHDIVLELEKLGYTVEASHHEVGPGQNEINFTYADVIETCDRVQTFKQVFYDPNAPKQLSKIARKWISGIIRYAREMSAVTNPIVNSYKRLVPGYEAPCYICWSDANRSSMIRIPAVRKKATRTEIRNVDPAANPYLAFACILDAGLKGIAEEYPDVEPVYDNIFEYTREEREQHGIKNLPENLKDAVKELKQSQFMKEALGEHIFNKYIIAKELEWDEYRVLVTDWEIKKYL